MPRARKPTSRGKTTPGWVEGPDLSCFEDLQERTDKCGSRGCGGAQSGAWVRRGTRAAEVGRGSQAGEGAPEQLPQVSCQKSNHKKAGGEQQGKEGEKGDGKGGRGENSPSTPIAWQGDVSNTWLVQRE